MERTFRKRLLDWYRSSHRPLPWREISDPYAIWVSEIMLQQTRVAAVLPYYSKFLQAFPTAASLAHAHEEDLLKVWSGLGYYSRVRNMQKAARQMGGSFPTDHRQIRDLAGIGDYTAAAVASIAFGLPYAAVDGNVMRVLSRVMNDSSDIDATATRRKFQEVADRLLDRKHPGVFNQAMMELGATVCLPKNPECRICPVASVCEAARSGEQNQLPVKLRRKVQISVARTLLIVRQRGRLLFWKRDASSRKLPGFWELPEPEHLPGVVIGCTQAEFRHSITNHTYMFRVCEAFVKSVGPGLHWLPPMREHLFSTTTRKALGLLGFHLSNRV